MYVYIKMIVCNTMHGIIFDVWDELTQYSVAIIQIQLFYCGYNWIRLHEHEERLQDRKHSVSQHTGGKSEASQSFSPSVMSVVA